MTIDFRCAQCNQLLKVPDTSAGKNARCPKCQTLMQIPAATTPPARVPAPPAGFAPPPPPPPPPPPNFGPPGPAAQPGPFGFPGGGGSSAPSPSGGSRKKNSFDFLGGAPAPSAQAPPPPYGAPPPPYGAPPPPPPPPGGGGFALNTSGPVNPYASPSSSAGGYYAATPPAKGGRQGLPWEKKPYKKGMLTAFFDTAKLVAFDPSRAFSQMHQQGDMGGPMLYSGLGLTIGILALAVWAIAILFIATAALGGRPEAYGIIFLLVMLYAGAYLIIGVPMGATLGNLLGGAVLHVCLMICGGSKHTFDTSFRIQCYVGGSLMLAAIFPPVLPFLGIWQLICTIIAIHKAHEVPMGKAVLTVLLPAIVAIVLPFILFMLMFMVGAAASLR